MTPTDRRFIEETFPVREVSEHSAKEKNIRHGHISTLHIWWARRPLAASRATAYAALVPPPADILEWQNQRDFIIDLCKWENSLNPHLLAHARGEIYAAHAVRLSAELGQTVTVEDIEAGKYPPPRVLDPFAGGGSYPLEALRLGCEAYANDYNPVAVLIEKATLEFPQKYGRPFEGMPEWAHPSPPAPPLPKLWERGMGGEGQESTRALIERARQLRKEATSAEELLWQLLRNRQLVGRKFRRQHPIGPFITDFFCDDARLIIEIDGAIHQEADQKQRDQAREEILRAYNYHILRFSNHEVLHETERVLDEIARFVQTQSYEQPPQSTQSQRRDNSGAAGQIPLFETAQAASQHDFNPLLKAVRYWGNWVLEEARKELADYYPPSPSGRGIGGEGRGETIVGYIWARTLPCQNPACGVEIPLMRQYWLAKKDKRKIALHPLIKGAGQAIEFEIVAQDVPGYAPWPSGFDPEKGSVARAVVTCPACGATMDANTTRRLFREVGVNGRSPAGQRMVAVVTTRPATDGKFYRLPTEADLQAYRAAAQALQAKAERLCAEWGMQPVPDEPISDKMPGGFHTPTYGMDTWGKLFNPRQQLALLTFAEAVRRAHAAMLAQGYPEDFARAVVTYLGIILSRHSSYNATLCWWEPLGERGFNVFGRQALPMVFDNAEQVPFGPLTGNWSVQTDISCEIIEHLSHLTPLPRAGEGLGVRVTHASATRLPYPDGFFDAVLTDPPYYYSVTYADLSDFFYVWLKRSIVFLYPELFSTPLTPKSDEIIEKKFWDKTSEQDKTWYEKRLRDAFQEIYRVLKPSGIASIVYAHKTTEGWETVINALLDSKLVVTSAWPINTEMNSRLMANESAALSSSIYIVARKMPRQGTAFYGEVRSELRRYLDKKLQRLWEEGVSGADFFIAAIGAGIEVFGKYVQVMNLEGNLIRADRLLDEVRTLATDFAVRQILHDGFAGEVSDRTRLYVLWRWNYGEARVPFDEARKLAQSCGLDLTEEWNRRGGFVRKEQEFVRLLGPHQRELDALAHGRDLIDVLHHALRLWEKGERGDLIQRLAASGYGNSEAFYRVAQAVSESLPIESKEKKLLDGMLTGRARLQDEVRQARLL